MTKQKAGIRVVKKEGTKRLGTLRGYDVFLDDENISHLVESIQIELSHDAFVSATIRLLSVVDIDVGAEIEITREQHHWEAEVTKAE